MIRLARPMLFVAAMSRDHFPFAVVAVVGLALTACVPQSRFRDTGVVPETRALGWDGETVKAGNLRVEGQIHQTVIEENLTPVLHDTALHVATTTVDGVATLAVVDHLELGGRVSYAAYDWTSETAAGTMPVPGHPAVWGYGPEMRWSLPLDDQGRFHLGFGGNVLSYSLPIARWKLDPTCTQNCFDGYTLDSTGSERMWVLNVAFYPSIAFGPGGAYGHLFGGWSAHDAFRNDGFTDQLASGGGKPQNDGMVSYLGAGYGITFRGVRVSSMLYMPLNANAAIKYGPGAFLTLGGTLPLWRPYRDRSRRPAN